MPICQSTDGLLDGMIASDPVVAVLDLIEEASSLVERLQIPTLRPSDFELLYTMVEFSMSRRFSTAPAKIEAERLA